jgi:hypothetical protein
VITVTDALWYRGGVSGVSRVVGNDWEGNGVISRVARYTFTAPPEGASKVRLSFNTNSFGDGSYIKIRYYIGTSDTSHANAGADSEYTGEFTMDTTYFRFTAETDIILVPNETYYLWVFPGSDDFGWYYWNNDGASSIEVEGAAGLVYIDSGSGFEPYLAYVDNGTSWDMCIPYVDNGTSWDMYS